MSAKVSRMSTAAPNPYGGNAPLYTPGQGVPLAEPTQGRGCLKWGGIAAGILALIALAGSCGEGTGTSVVETTTVTVRGEASTVTTTATTTVTKTASAPTEMQQEPEEPVDVPEEAVDVPEAPAPVADQPAQFFAPPPAPAQAPAQQSAYYANCSEARSAGAAPLYAGEPGYRSALDRDGDGVACE